jgi:hypothetical protein
MMQSFPIDDYYMMDNINSVGHPRSDLVVLLVLCTVRYAMAGAPILYYGFVNLVENE